MMDWDSFTPLTALTHLDGRNSRKLSALKPHFSEFAWMKLRLDVIVSYVKSISTKLTGKTVPRADDKKLSSLIDSFSLTEARKVVQLEKTVNHDLKAIELYLVNELMKRKLARYIPYVNLGIGSEDINSIALGLQLVGSRGEILIPEFERVVHSLSILAEQEKNTLMIARTHGQSANVTTFGKELANTLSRLLGELEIFRTLQLQAKCLGEVGTLQAFIGVDSSIDWLKFTDMFVETFGLQPSHAGTQVTPYDSVIRYLQSLFRMNGILLDLVKNLWLYVLMGYLIVKKKDSEVGSAGMPHKVNPIYFEGTEGGLEMANGIIETLVRKLPINRLQRDFSDSTLRRNLVMPIALGLLSYQSIVKGLSRIAVNREAMRDDLCSHAEVWVETVKTYGLMHGISDMYDRLKKETRGRTLSASDLEALISGLPLSTKEKKELINLCDGTHNPYPARIVDEIVKRSL